MTRRAWLALAVCGSAAAWFGVRLGPRSKESLQTEPAATLAAQDFVTRMTEKNGGSCVTFLDTSVTKQDGFWHAVGSGSATMDGRQGRQRFDFDLSEAWVPESHSWRLKSLDITRTKGR